MPRKLPRRQLLYNFLGCRQAKTHSHSHFSIAHVAGRHGLPYAACATELVSVLEFGVLGADAVFGR